MRRGGRGGGRRCGVLLCHPSNDNNKNSSTKFQTVHGSGCTAVPVVKTDTGPHGHGGAAERCDMGAAARDKELLGLNQVVPGAISHCSTRNRMQACRF